MRLNLFKKNFKDEVIFLHYLTTDNVGDLSCCPKNYFSRFKNCKELEIYNYNHSNPKNKTFIIGGGGLLQEFFKKSIEEIVKLKDNNNVIFWGVGLDNSPIGKIVDADIINGCKLLGIRDFNTQYKYVPCVSCMSVLFDKYRNTKPKKKIRCYIHSEYEFPAFLIDSFEIYKNNQDYGKKNALNNALKFLSGAEYIITNSFHGAYWATLLNRKVIVLPFSRNGNTKFSDKFLTLKYEPVYVENPDDIEYCLIDKLKEAQNYENALSDARAHNINFYNQVIDVIENKK